MPAPDAGDDGSHTMDESDAESEYTVSEILDERGAGPELCYYIKWSNYSIDRATWEPASNLAQGNRETMAAWQRKKDWIQMGYLPPFDHGEAQRKGLARRIERKDGECQRLRLGGFLPPRPGTEPCWETESPGDTVGADSSADDLDSLFESTSDHASRPDIRAMNVQTARFASSEQVCSKNTSPCARVVPLTQFPSRHGPFKDRNPGNINPGNIHPGNTHPRILHPRDYTPQNRTPRDKTPKDQTPRDKTPKDKTPRNQTPRDKTPKDQIPRDKTLRDQPPKDIIPKVINLKDTAVKDQTPKDNSLKDRTLKDRVPKEKTPKDTIPRDTAPKDTKLKGTINTLKGPVAKETVPKEILPKGTAKGAVPKGTIYKVTVPKGSIPKGIAAKSTTPERYKSKRTTSISTLSRDILSKSNLSSTSPKKGIPHAPKKDVPRARVVSCPQFDKPRTPRESSSPTSTKSSPLKRKPDFPARSRSGAGTHTLGTGPDISLRSPCPLHRHNLLILLPAYIHINITINILIDKQLTTNFPRCVFTPLTMLYRYYLTYRFTYPLTYYLLYRY